MELIICISCYQQKVNMVREYKNWIPRVLVPILLSRFPASNRDLQ
jgi:hypothetical protein